MTIGACAWLLAAADENSSKFRVNVDMVQVRAAVTDGSGRYVRNLTANDFRIFENGIEQKIQSVSTPAASPQTPTSVFVLFDTSNRMYETFVYAEDAIANFIRQLDPADPVAVYGFSRNVTRLAPLSGNRWEALSGLRRAVSGDETALYDAILVTLRDAARTWGNRVLVVFSNGPDNASLLSPDEVRSVAEDAGIPVYVVSTQGHNPLSNSAFHDLTENTGGRTYFATEWQREKLAFEAIDQELNNSYVISYYPSAHAAPGYRRIEIRIAGDDAHSYRIRARTGYRAADQPQAARPGLILPLAVNAREQ